MKKISLLASGLILSAGMSFAQTLSPTVLAAAGDVFYGGNVSLSWTLGELAITTVSSPGNMLTQGFHQPENGIAIGISNPDRSINVNAFPNPIAENLTLEISTAQSENFSVEITDVLGRTIKTATLYVGDGQAKHVVQMSTYAPGAYLVKVSTKDGKFSKAFKLTKI